MTSSRSSHSSRSSRSSRSSHSTVILAEKPSVARDLAQAVQAGQRGEGYFYGNGYVVTWAIGHLVTLPEPHQINPNWKSWSFSHLPMLPTEWPLTIVERTRQQFDVVEKLLRNCEEVICATDAGREGELIFRYIYELAKCRKPVRRLWISSLTSEAIKSGLRALRPAHEFDSLANAARARSRADWLVGMNLSRAYALKTREPLFVGRVQTPTLAIVVERDRKIRDFKPEDYTIIEAQFGEPPVEEIQVGVDAGSAAGVASKAQAGAATYRGIYLGEKADVAKAISKDGVKPAFAKEKRLSRDPKEVDPVLERIRGGVARIASIDAKTNKQSPPLLYDLTELQRHCNRVFGLSAARTLEVAQSLYERHKLISYPRTDSRHLSRTVAETLPAIVDAIRAPYEEHLIEATGRTPLGKRFVDDSQVTDHHAIIPLAHAKTSQAAVAGLSSEERKVYDLICRRLLSAWQSDYMTEVTTILTEVNALDVFRTQGTAVQVLGWKALDLKGRDPSPEPDLPSGMKPGMPVRILTVEPLKKTTQPPPHLTEATLLTGMETAGHALEDQELAAAMRGSGLGTPATRAGIIETLLSRGYIERKGKSLIATPLGHRVIETVHESVKSPELTARWEKKLSEIQAGKKTLQAFIAELEAEMTRRVAEISAADIPVSGEPHRVYQSVQQQSAYQQHNPHHGPQHGPQHGLQSNPQNGPHQMRVRTRTVTPSNELHKLLKERFGFDTFRQAQESVCRTVTDGRDVLVVMPTGAGKSLCYQVPGLARGGTTLVISPLVALIEDQVAKLQAWGFNAERIHSGCARADSRRVCEGYLVGDLDFLFIAPERLAVPGFPEFLRRHPPTLIAIDEAHCISQWGHDFRPDYRLVGERLKELRPTPIIAMTATATPVVQEDICKQLGLRNEERFIEGFRRTNIAIQVAQLAPGERNDAIVSVLSKPDRLPAIVYAPTRKKAEELQAYLSGRFRVDCYHAGLSASAREKVQSQYLGGTLDVIVATIAFGMGIDKPNVRTVIHAALPGSVEGYYQEIGRAGRDGLPSQALLLHSFVDQKTHEFFLNLNYPEVAELKRIFAKLGNEPKAKDTVRASLRSLDLDTFERALEQLWVHRGVTIDPEENMVRGDPRWEDAYLAQREERRKQMQRMVAFTSTSRCRMLTLVSHFGDRKDSTQKCGVCDVCNPSQSQADSLVPKRALSEKERTVVKRILANLAGQEYVAAGRLFQDLSDSGHFLGKRGDFEKLVAVLTAAGWLTLTQASFEKDGETIQYRKLSLTPLGKRATSDDIAELEIVGVEGSAGASGKSRRKRKSKAAAPVKRNSASARGRERRVDIDDAAIMARKDVQALRAWRLERAREKKIPAFRILTDRVLWTICEVAPRTKSDLSAISGIGRNTLTQYGDDILQVLRRS